MRLNLVVPNGLTFWCESEIHLGIELCVLHLLLIIMHVGEIYDILSKGFNVTM